MAEVQTSSGKDKKKGRKQLSTRVDLTPMVDLGFLLITFFIFTTTMSNPASMRMILPDESDPASPNTYSEEKTLNLLLQADNKISYYTGTNVNSTQQTDLSPRGLRQVIIDKQAQLRQTFKNKPDMLVLIKPTDASTCGNLVDVLDEMKINNVTRYMLLNPSAEENALIAQK